MWKGQKHFNMADQDFSKKGEYVDGSIPGWGYGLELISAEALRALIRVRAEASRAIRRFFEDSGLLEVTTASLTQMSGSCENPATMFSVPYYDRTAFLAQSAQLQLEVIVGLLRQPAFTFTTSFRAEDYITDRNSGRRLSEFSLIEAEGPGWTLETLIRFQEEFIASVLRRLLAHVEPDIISLGGKPDYLASIKPPFPRVNHSTAVQLLIKEGFRPPSEGAEMWDFGIKEELFLIEHHGGVPLFLIHHPKVIKYFNMKQDGELTLSVDLLAPPLGEISGGGERESNHLIVRDQLDSSRMIREIIKRGGHASEFDWYIRLLESPGLPQRAGFGLGFERLVGFLINADDILRCLEFPRTDRSLFP